MFKITARVLLTTAFAASLVGCSNMNSTAKKEEACCPESAKPDNNGKAVVVNQAKPNAATMPTTQPSGHQH